MAAQIQWSQRPTQSSNSLAAATAPFLPADALGLVFSALNYSQTHGQKSMGSRPKITRIQDAISCHFALVARIQRFGNSNVKLAIPLAPITSGIGPLPFLRHPSASDVCTRHRAHHVTCPGAAATTAFPRLLTDALPPSRGPIRAVAHHQRHQRGVVTGMAI